MTTPTISDALAPIGSTRPDIAALVVAALKHPPESVLAVIEAFDEDLEAAEEYEAPTAHDYAAAAAPLAFPHGPRPPAG